MACAIRLCYGPMLASHPRLASGTVGLASRPSRVHLGLNQPSHFLSNCSKNHQVALPVWRANCMLENSSMPSKNEENENKIVRGMTGISLVLACVLGVFSFNGMMNSKSATAYALTLKRSISSRDSPPSTVQTIPQIGGALALDSLLKMLKCAPVPLDRSSYRPQLPEKPSKEEIDKLKLYASGLSKSGKPQDALKLLDDAYKKNKDQREARQFLRMASIELLIVQENYQEARKLLDQLINDAIIEAEGSKQKLSEEDKISKLEDMYPFEISKAEICLYKAIVHTVLERKDAAKWWEAFGSTLG